VEVWRSYNKNNFACFLRHGVYRPYCRADSKVYNTAEKGDNQSLSLALTTCILFGNSSREKSVSADVYPLSCFWCLCCYGVSIKHIYHLLNDRTGIVHDADKYLAIRHHSRRLSLKCSKLFCSMLNCEIVLAVWFQEKVTMQWTMQYFHSRQI